MQSKPRLIIIPVIHTRADYGSLGSKIPVDQEYEAICDQYWCRVFEYVQGLSLDFSKIKVYQDGLPDTTNEIVSRIVDETQTPNYDLLRWLRERGVCVVGTEKPSLLLQEYNALKAIFNAETEKQKYAVRLEYAKMGAYLLEDRDRYISQRIKTTCSEGEIGLLFLGLEHNVKSLLEHEMEISEPETLIGTSSETLRKKISGKEKEA